MLVIVQIGRPDYRSLAEDRRSPLGVPRPVPRSGPLILRRAIDLAPERLAPRIGSWASPALLEGGQGLGPAGRWSILAARPRRVLESADGTSFRWSGGS